MKQITGIVFRINLDTGVFKFRQASNVTYWAVFILRVRYSQFVFVVHNSNVRGHAVA
jgi:hypothetical protein